jgi:endonuclease/exonuclease/phosphatase (EEP) superfamily protein YafD
MNANSSNPQRTLRAATTFWRRAWRTVRVAGSAVLLVIIFVMIAAQLVRDRAVWLNYCLYAPLWVLAIVTIAWDLLNLGKALPLRFLMFLIGCGIGVMSVGMMWAPARAPEGNANQPAVKVLHWNMQWGGLAGPASLEKIVSTMLSHDPQIVCLTEVPHESYFGHYWRTAAGPGWHGASTVLVQQYMCRLSVLSKSPVRRAGQWPLDHGVAALFEIDLPEMPSRPFRVMMVDIESDPNLPRSPSIIQAAKLVDDFATRGQPIDVVAGDFNTPSRFRGFDALTRAGERYERAALWSGQWRATWPARLVSPFRGKTYEFRNTWRLSTLDIDHLFVRTGLDVAAAEIFTSDVVDHRGQTCTIRLPANQSP